MRACNSFLKLASVRRFADLWTTSGGTLDNSLDLEGKVDTALQQAGLSQLLFFDDATTTTLGAGDYAHSLFFKHSGLAHSDVPRHYFQPLMIASGFAPLK